MNKMCVGSRIVIWSSVNFSLIFLVHQVSLVSLKAQSRGTSARKVTKNWKVVVFWVWNASRKKNSVEEKCEDWAKMMEVVWGESQQQRALGPR